jgi:hypothetical protein
VGTDSDVKMRSICRIGIRTKFPIIISEAIEYNEPKNALLYNKTLI